MKLSIPENLYAYTKDESKIIEGGILYANHLLKMDEHRFADYYDINIINYIDDNQFHYLLAIGKSDNDIIEYARKLANQHIQVLVSESYIPQPIDNTFIESDLPF
jgi:hypothetical protein